MSVELPKDAEGREIPLDTTVLFDKDGEELCVKRIEFDPFKKEWELGVRKDLSSRLIVYRRPCVVYLEKPAPPDSWEKLEEDMTRAINAPKPYNYDSMTCGYFDSAGSSCQECKKKNGFDSFNCNTVAWKDILSRIRKLRGEDE